MLTTDRIMTGRPAIDGPLGGLHPGGFYVIAGRVMGGRTPFDYAYDLAEGMEGAEVVSDLTAAWERALERAASEGLRVMAWVVWHFMDEDFIDSVRVVREAARKYGVALVLFTYTRRAHRKDPAPVLADLPGQGELEQMANAIALISADGSAIRWAKNRGEPLPDEPAPWGAR